MSAYTDHACPLIDLCANAACSYKWWPYKLGGCKDFEATEEAKKLLEKKEVYRAQAS